MNVDRSEKGWAICSTLDDARQKEKITRRGYEFSLKILCDIFCTYAVSVITTDLLSIDAINNSKLK